jgi:hypothetical protein
MIATALLATGGKLYCFTALMIQSIRLLGSTRQTEKTESMILNFCSDPCQNYKPTCVPLGKQHQVFVHLAFRAHPHYAPSL